MLKIGVIGYSVETLKQAMQIIKNHERHGPNGNNIQKLNKYILKTDDVCYYFIPTQQGLWGARFDQVIIAEDCKGLIYDDKEFIWHAKNTLKRSLVPDEFQVITLTL